MCWVLVLPLALTLMRHPLLVRECFSADDLRACVASLIDRNDDCCTRVMLFLDEPLWQLLTGVLGDRALVTLIVRKICTECGIPMCCAGTHAAVSDWARRVALSALREADYKEWCCLVALEPPGLVSRATYDVLVRYVYHYCTGTRRAVLMRWGRVVVPAAPAGPAVHNLEELITTVLGRLEIADAGESAPVRQFLDLFFATARPLWSYWLVRYLVRQLLPADAWIREDIAVPADGAAGGAVAGSEHAPAPRRLSSVRPLSVPLEASSVEKQRALVIDCLTAVGTKLRTSRHLSCDKAYCESVEQLEEDWTMLIRDSTAWTALRGLLAFLMGAYLPYGHAFLGFVDGSVGRLQLVDATTRAKAVVFGTGLNPLTIYSKYGYGMFVRVPGEGYKRVIGRSVMPTSSQEPMCALLLLVSGAGCEFREGVTLRKMCNCDDSRIVTGPDDLPTDNLFAFKNNGSQLEVYAAMLLSVCAGYAGLSGCGWDQFMQAMVTESVRYPCHVVGYHPGRPVMCLWN